MRFPTYALGLDLLGSPEVRWAARLAGIGSLAHNVHDPLAAFSPSARQAMAIGTLLRAPSLRQAAAIAQQHIDLVNIGLSLLPQLDYRALAALAGATLKETSELDHQ